MTKNLTGLLLMGALLGGAAFPVSAAEPETREEKMTDFKNLTDAQWKERLTPDQYRVARMKGTEAPFSGEYWNTRTSGTYHCVACDLPLFRSDAKFDAGCGWPSYFEPVTKEAVEYAPDTSHGMNRTEVLCGRCGAHLGHVFEDGPPPTDKRYCINSVSLVLKPD